MRALLMLQQRDSYGYDIANELSRTISISDGTVYPILRHLKQDGYDSSYLKFPGGVTLAIPTGTPFAGRQHKPKQQGNESVN